MNLLCNALVLSQRSQLLNFTNFKQLFLWLVSQNILLDHKAKQQVSANPEAIL
jgi:hypothetical protein